MQPGHGTAHRKSDIGFISASVRTAVTWMLSPRIIVQGVVVTMENKFDFEVTISECTRQNLCVDCDNEECWFCGKPEADCPVYQCKYPEYFDDCAKCPLLKRYQKEMREEYAKEENTDRPDYDQTSH